MENKASYNYSFADFGRHADGKLTSEEHKRFEDQLKSDPFLLEAYEGFLLHRDQLEGIGAESGLSKPSDSAIIKPLVKQTWFRVAASVLFLVSASFLTYSIFNSGDAKLSSLSSKENNNKEVLKTQDSAENRQNQADLIPDENANLVEESKPESEIKEALDIEATNLQSANEESFLIQQEFSKIEADAEGIQTEEVSEKKRLTIANNEKLRSAADDVLLDGQELTLSPSAAPLLQKREEKKQRLIQGVILDADNQPLIGANILIPGTKKGTNSDIEGNFSLHLDSVLSEIEVQYVGYENQRVQIDDRLTINVIMDENEAILSEVAVRGYRVTKPDKGTAEPVGGFFLFEKYLKENSSFEKDEQVNRSYQRRGQQKVTLQFKVDQQGNIYDIETVGVKNTKYEAEAILLLKNGPLWKIDEHYEYVQTMYSFYFN